MNLIASEGSGEASGTCVSVRKETDHLLGYSSPDRVALLPPPPGDIEQCLGTIWVITTSTGI